jgi:predicted porin
MRAKEDDMQRNASTAVLALCVASASPALAQSALNIYGVADAALVYSSNQNGASNVYMRSGNLAASRIGFKGSEDLGQGLQALFQLEGGYEIDTGHGAYSARAGSDRRRAPRDGGVG